MSTKTITIRVCDCCGKEIKGRLTADTCPCCKQEFCRECFEKANPKPQKEAPATEEERPEPPRRQDEATTRPAYFHVNTQPENGVYAAFYRPAGQAQASREYQAHTLKEAIIGLFPDGIPADLPEKDKETIRGILEGGKE